MAVMIESMESRVLLTASAAVIAGDLVAGQAALSTAKLDLKSALKGVALDVKAFKADIKGIKLTAAQKSDLSTLEKGVAVDSAKVSSLISHILATGTSRGAQLESDLKSLKAHPNSTAIQVKVAAALVKLQAVFSTTVIGNVESVVAADVTVIDADLANVGTAIPSTSGTASATTLSLANDQLTLTTDVTSIESVIAQLGIDLA